MADDRSWMTAPTGPDPRRPWPAGTFLAHLPEQEWQRMQRLGALAKFPDGELLLEQDRPGAADVLVILEGFVLVTHSERGRDPVALAIRRRGDLVGEMARRTPGKRRTASVRACDAVTAWRVPEDVFWGGDQPMSAGVSRALTEVYAHKLDGSDRWLRDFRVRPGQACTARVLLELAERHGQDTSVGEREIVVPLTQRDLAAIAGMSVPSIERGLATLRERDVIRTAGARHTVLHMGRLRSLARRPLGSS